MLSEHQAQRESSEILLCCATYAQSVHAYIADSTDLAALDRADTAMARLIELLAQTALTNEELRACSATLSLAAEFESGGQPTDEQQLAELIADAVQKHLDEEG